MKKAYLNTLQIHDNSINIGIYLKPNIQGLEIPSIRLPNFEKPNVDGAFVPNQLYGGRSISLEGRINSSSVTGYRQKRRELEAQARIYRPGDILTPVTFKFTTMDDLDLQVEAYVKNLVMPDKLLTSADFNLSLFSPDIRINSQVLHEARLNIFEGGGMPIPMGIPMTMANGATVETQLLNSGDFTSYPTMIIYGTIEDPTITNVTTGESFSIDYTLTSADERIEIDFKKHTVLYFSSPTANGVNIRDKFSNDFWLLAPGNNTVKLIVVDSADTGYAVIRWRDSYLGV